MEQWVKEIIKTERDKRNLPLDAKKLNNNYYDSVGQKRKESQEILRLYRENNTKKSHGKEKKLLFVK